MPCDRCEANRELRMDAEMYRREAQKELVAANARIAALEAALRAVRNFTRSPLDGGSCWCVTPDVRVHGPACQQARAALAGTPETVSDSLVSDTATTTLSDSEATVADMPPAPRRTTSCRQDRTPVSAARTAWCRCCEPLLYSHYRCILCTDALRVP